MCTTQVVRYRAFHYEADSSRFGLATGWSRRSEAIGMDLGQWRPTSAWISDRPRQDSIGIGLGGSDGHAVDIARPGLSRDIVTTEA